MDTSTSEFIQQQLNDILHQRMGPFAAMTAGAQRIWAIIFVSFRNQKLPSPTDLYFMAMKEGMLWLEKYPDSAQGFLAEMVENDDDDLNTMNTEAIEAYNEVYTHGNDELVEQDDDQFDPTKAKAAFASMAEDEHLEGQFEDSISGDAETSE